MISLEELRIEEKNLIMVREMNKSLKDIFDRYPRLGAVAAGVAQMICRWWSL